MEFKAYKEMQLGERVQIDSMTVTKNGVTIKHFQAWERCSKHLFARVYSHAKASSAKRFLMDFVKQAPLMTAVAKYNTYRPHFALNGITPMQYLHINHPETLKTVSNHVNLYRYKMPPIPAHQVMLIID